ncbi:MAG: biotin/lipoyl-binding protein, partial [Planctomycetota bacterium]
MSRVDVDRLRLEPQQRRLSNGYARWLLALLILLGAGGAFLHDRWSPDDSNLKSRPNNVLLASEPPAPLAPVEEERVVVAGGFLEARRDATLSPGRDGVVAAVHVKPGQKVRMGELLLELVARTSRAELAAAEAELAIASARLALAKAGARAEEKQRAQARSAAAEAEWQEKKSQLARSRRLSERQVLSESEFESAERDERVARARLA